MFNEVAFKSTISLMKTNDLLQLWDKLGGMNIDDIILVKIRIIKSEMKRRGTIYEETVSKV